MTRNKKYNYKDDLKVMLDYGRKKNRKGEGSYSFQTVIQDVITWNDFKQMTSGISPIDRIVVDRLLYRVGIAPENIEMIITEKDYERYQARCQIYKLYGNGDYEEAKKQLVEYKGWVKNEHPIHQQFAAMLYAKIMWKQNNHPDKILSILKDALAYTVTEWKQKSPDEICLAPDELEIILLMADCYRRKNFWDKAEYMISWVMEYSRKHVMEKEVWKRFLPLVYLESAKLRKEEIALKYIKTGILLCYQAASLFYLIPLQNYYLNLMQVLEQKNELTKTQRRNKRRILEERNCILELCREVEVDWKTIEPKQVYYNTYVFSEVLQRYRNYVGQSKRLFCEDICTENAYDAIEKGISIPRKKFLVLTERMGLPTTYMIAPLHGVTKVYMDQKVQINELITRYRYKEAEKLLEKLEFDLKRKRLLDLCPRNKQFFFRVHAILDTKLYGISREESRKRLEEAIRLTMPEYPKLDFSKKILLTQEVYILNNLAVSYREEGDYRDQKKNYKKAMEIWKGIQKSYQTSKLYGLAEYRGYDKILSNYISCIGSSGDYYHSTKLEYESIKHFLELGTINYLADACYGIAWNQEEEMKIKYGKIKKETACQKKLKQAIILAKMIRHTFLVEFLEKHWKEYN